MVAADIPKKQWAQVFEKKGGPIEFKQIDVPTPGPDEVLVNIKYSGVCHTDLHALKGDWPVDTKLPLVGGHEGAGVVVQLGSLVKDIQIGDHVGIKWLGSSCGSCEFCLKGFESCCLNAGLSGYTRDGSFQQYALGVAKDVARIPKDVPLDAVAPILCAGLTVYKALKQSDARPGEIVALPGAGGGLGALAIQYARAMGLRVLAIDTGKEKEDLCKSLGAEWFLDFTKVKDLVGEIKKLTDGGPHAVVVTAASEQPLEQATEYVRSRGVVVSVGLPAHAFIKSNVFWTVLREITIKGSYVGGRQDTNEAIDFFRRGLVKVPFKTKGLSELQAVYDEMEEGKIAGRIVVDTSK